MNRTPESKLLAIDVGNLMMVRTESQKAADAAARVRDEKTTHPLNDSSSPIRVEVRYDGVVMTDDLDMGAIKPNHDIDTAIDQILLSDVDIALICHKGPDIESAYERIRRSITDDDHLRQMGIRSVRRILVLKKAYLKGDWEQGYEMPVS